MVKECSTGIWNGTRVDNLLEGGSVGVLNGNIKEVQDEVGHCTAVVVVVFRG
jgi:hypothetical protein